MFRRIELITNTVSGLCGTITMADYSLGDLPSPKHLNKNCRFFFTEAGWNKYGRSIMQSLNQCNQPYRVIAIKENERDIFYQDQWQVAVRSKRGK